MGSHISTDKKLQLIRKIRQEHQMNRNTIRGRESFLYGKSMPYESFPDMDMETVPDMELPVSTFRFRIAAALLLFGFFYLVSSRGETVFGIQPAKVHEAVETDYSPILFDFMENIPYTLHETDTGRPLSAQETAPAQQE